VQRILSLEVISLPKDKEIKSTDNAYDFGAGIYDSRLGRWLSCDPHQIEYPFCNPYLQFGGEEYVHSAS